MRTLKYVLAFLAFFGATKYVANNWHWAWIPIIAVLFALLILIYYKRQERQMLVALNRRIDHVFVIVRTEDGKVVLPKVYEDLVIHTTKDRLYNTVLKLRSWIEKSANKHGIKVKLIIYQDGENINENPEQYRQRVIDEIMEARILQHTNIKEADPEYYLKAHHGVEPKRKPFTGRNVNGSTFEWDN